MVTNLGPIPKKLGFLFAPSRKDNLKSDTTVLCNMIHKNQIELRKSVTLTSCNKITFTFESVSFFLAPSNILFANFVQTLLITLKTLVKERKKN